MTEMPIAQAKARFAEVLHRVELGEEIVITRGTRKVTVAAVIPMEEYRARKERRLGTLKHWGPIAVSEDWSITEAELLNS